MHFIQPQFISKSKDQPLETLYCNDENFVIILKKKVIVLNPEELSWKEFMEEP
jgi:hypothetical protein